jgi:hypothetical protein
MNSNKKSVQKKISLNDYGEFVSVYRGSGTVSIIDGAGEKPHQCSFEAGQMINGDIILLCHDLPAGFSFFFRFGMQAKKFEGKTKEGHLIRSNEPRKSLLQLGYLTKPENWLYDQNLALEITELSITYSKEQCHKIHFGICNFQFDENDTLENGKEDNKVVIPLTEEEKIEISFKKLDDYDNKINQISILRTIDVTCELVLKISNRGDLNKIIPLVDDICLLLSIKKGTKISWIYYDVYDNQGKTIFRRHISKVTKAYQPLDIFYFKESHTFQTKKFLEDSYLYYMKYRDLLKLNRGVIDAYLDAKAEKDYIETRGGKIALAIEFLKNEYLGSKGKNSEYIFPPQDFKKSIPSVSAAMVSTLKLQGVSDQNKIQSISSEKKIEGLNRRSFGNILREIIKEFHVNISSDEITLFIKCRDSLVHRGNFYCKTCRSDEIRECEPLPSYMFEYFFMVNVLDRFFLRLLEQDDKLIRIDWRNPSEKMIEWLK